jgi:soluble lytic murein transglycosylase-like protein
MEPHLKVAAARFGVDVGLLAGIVYVESTFNPAARNRSGATGLMQVMPRNADRLDCGDLGDPDDNIACGVEVLQRFMKRYDNHIVYGLSAYNAGYAVPNRALKAGTLPSNFSYVEKVLSSRTRYLRHGCG